jgi:uncharacterized protein YkwD
MRTVRSPGSLDAADSPACVQSAKSVRDSENRVRKIIQKYSRIRTGLGILFAPNRLEGAFDYEIPATNGFITRIKVRPDNRMKPSTIKFLLLLIFVQDPAFAAEKPPDQIPHPDETRTMVLAINLLRTSKGLLPFRIDPGLCRAADLHAHDMAERNYFSHRGPQSMFASTPGSRAFRQGYTWARIAENICAGYPNASAAFNSFLFSKPHYQNMVNPVLLDIGIGVAKSEANRLYWVMLLGRQSNLAVR